jgi:hypothetical protein
MVAADPQSPVFSDFDSTAFDVGGKTVLGPRKLVLAAGDPKPVPVSFGAAGCVPKLNPLPVLVLVNPVPILVAGSSKLNTGIETVFISWADFVSKLNSDLAVVVGPSKLNSGTLNPPGGSPVSKLKPELGAPKPLGEFEDPKLDFGAPLSVGDFDEPKLNFVEALSVGAFDDPKLSFEEALLVGAFEEPKLNFVEALSVGEFDDPKLNFVEALSAGAFADPKLNFGALLSAGAFDDPKLNFGAPLSVGAFADPNVNFGVPLVKPNAGTF